MPFFIPKLGIPTQWLVDSKQGLIAFTNMRSHQVNIERNIDNMQYACSFKLSYQGTNIINKVNMKDLNIKYLQVLQPL